MAVMPWRLKHLTRRAQVAIQTSSAYEWSSRAAEARTQRRAPTFNPRDALMILVAFSDLRVRGPEVQPVCYKCSVVIATATHSRQRGGGDSHDVSVASVGEAVVALASLQARSLPALNKALLPRLLELNAHDHNERFLQRVGFALVKLGGGIVSGDVSDHVLFLLLEYITEYKPDDAVAITTAAALASMPSSVVASSILGTHSNPHPTAASTADQTKVSRRLVQVRAACSSLYGATTGSGGRRQEATQSLIMAVVKTLRKHVTSHNREDAPVEAAYLLVLLLSERLQQLGAVHGASGNGVFQLLHVWVPLFHMYREILRLNADMADAETRAAAIGVIQSSVSALPLVKCVPGGFAAWMHKSMFALTSAPISSLPFLKRLLWASADKGFAKAFNSYDVAKLADGLRQGAWDVWLSVEVPLSETALGAPATSPSPGPTTVADLLVAVTARLTDDLVFFAASPSNDQKHMDAVSITSVLRTQLRLLQSVVGARSLTRAFKVSVANAIQRQMERICTACILELPRGGHLSQWSVDGIPWAMQMLSNILLFASKTLAPRQLVVSASMTVVLEQLLCLAPAFSDACETNTVGVRESVLALLVGSSMLNLMSTQPALILSCFAVSDDPTERVRSAHATMLRLCLMGIEGPTQGGATSWAAQVKEDWAWLPSSERSAVLRSVGFLSSSIVASLSSFPPEETQQRSSHAAMVDKVRDHIGQIGDSFLRHVASQTHGPHDNSSGSMVQGGLDVVAIIDALCAVFTWLGDGKGTTANQPTSSRHAAIRSLFARLLEVPANTFPPHTFVKLLDAIAANRSVLLPRSFYPSSSLVLLRSDIKTLWDKQKYTLLQFEGGEGSGGDAHNDDQPFDEANHSTPTTTPLRGVAAHELTLVARAAACLRSMGFILVVGDPSPSLKPTSSSSLVAAVRGTSPQHNDKRKPLTAQDKRRIDIPLSTHHHLVAPTLLEEAVQLAALALDQKDRLQPAEVQAWGQALSPLVIRGIPQLSHRGMTTLLRSLRSPHALGLLIPRNVDRENMVYRCFELLEQATPRATSVTATSLAAVTEAVELAEGFAAAPHIESLLMTHIAAATTADVSLAGKGKSPRLPSNPALLTAFSGVVRSLTAA